MAPAVTTDVFIIQTIAGTVPGIMRLTITEEKKVTLRLNLLILPVIANTTVGNYHHSRKGKLICSHRKTCRAHEP